MCDDTLQDNLQNGAVAQNDVNEAFEANDHRHVAHGQSSKSQASNKTNESMNGITFT